ncbi:YusW family protein [Halalkalibacter sp. APA_J-10(15)]|uniref:YusW family protein n=1 Tax=unclassified Halalkalibacter TaxID=2893063 RepID=UPI001FF1650B|nr:YusW family protein [Halalkalibacter sp. APA_J-10(15)]MCK0471329.1 YusW family protein [Halalkalibacter sp. APA_J-10(15)]
MKKLMIVFVVMLSILKVTDVAASGTELMSAYSLRISAIVDGQDYEWEYDSPRKYEFEKGSQVMKGNEAKEQVEAIVTLLQISENQSIDEYVDNMKAEYPRLSKLDIRYMNEDGQLFTWVWNEE